MTDTLRDKLINKGWVTSFNADTLVRLIEEHYAELAKPVPVSERLPGDQLCWWLEPDEEDEAYGSSWTLLRIRGGTSSYTHWLPAQALPLPEVGE